MSEAYDVKEVYEVEEKSASSVSLAPSRSSASGQAMLEMALILAIMLPLTLGIVAIMDVVWTYHALVTLTRQGARYAATHCYQDDAGTNVTDWMKINAPAFL